MLAILFMLWILDLIRRDRLQERYSVIWFGAGLAMLAGAAFPGLLKLVADAMGVRDTNVALFSIVLLLLLGLALNFSVIMSRQAAQITRLAQERAIERAREQGAREALEGQLDGTAGDARPTPPRSPLKPRSGRAMTGLMATSTKPLPETGSGAELMAALATGIRSIYQPIVRLADRHVIAYEALARGPAGSPLELPETLFATARREGLETTLDWECWRAALRGASRAGWPRAGALRQRRALLGRLLGAGDRRPAAGGSPGELPARRRADRAGAANHTTDLIPLAEDLRRRGARIALDDVGTDPRSPRSRDGAPTRSCKPVP